MLFFFLFSSRRRHTRSLCDWSSDVCSSDLNAAWFCALVLIRAMWDPDFTLWPGPSRRWRSFGLQDRKSVVSGKSVDLGGRRIIKKKKKMYSKKGNEDREREDSGHRLVAKRD